MGIDGIGGKPPIGPGTAGLDSSTVGSSNRSGEGFSLESSSSLEPGSAVAGSQTSGEVSATQALDRFHAGELSLDEYMDTRVEKAVAHLANVLPPEQLEMLKETLKEQFKNDPGVAVLLQRATGVLPSDAELGDEG